MLAAGWEGRELPEQKKVPGLRMKRRFPELQSAVADDFHAEGRPSKRQRAGLPPETIAT